MQIIERDRAEKAIRDVQELLTNGRYQEAKDATIAFLQEEKLVAQMWVWLGEALEHLGDKAGAWKAYDRACLLDPQATWVARVEQRLAQFRQAVTPPWMAQLLAVKPVTVAAAIIVRDEERTIGETIDRLRPAVDQIVVVDTGSTDNTVEIIRNQGVEPLHFAWVDDFSAARNFALSHVTTDWVFCVDADELLFPEDVAQVRTVAGLFDGVEPAALVRIGIMNQAAGRVEPNYDVTRLFPARIGLRFWGRVHEQVAGPEGILSGTAYYRPSARIRLYHDGYEPDMTVQKDRFKRNISLLRKNVEDDPRDIASWAFLGRELLFSGEVEEGVRALYEADRLAPDIPQFGRMPEVWMFLIDALAAQGRFDEAITVAKRAVESRPDFPATWYAKGRAQTQFALNNLSQAQEAVREALTRAPAYRGIVSYDSSITTWRALATLGDIAKTKGNLVEARQLYRQALVASPGNPALEQQLQFIDEQARLLAGS
ncbi:TPR domain-containing glycosyltransferase [Alicyclobacillus sp. ALC3]|uniref:TPR domain-containing glycosyltransferase n=1 Tax=Alicyclobacillus sp. ALC3 TaxID=2796143 RepID=UPI0023786637|nr:TPR domain-containing glycosyltransferase [Alicyclobacillus sp. ALC3]WDL95308.1 tetratricopeptide repeat protein [Alicyclobacillus sp. ALC3]